MTNRPQNTLNIKIFFAKKYNLIRFFYFLNEAIFLFFKKLIVNPNGQLSLQSHEGRSEHWLVVEGRAEVIINDETYNLEENQHIFIPKGAKHRLANREDKTLVVIEMWFGNKLEENDIKRYEDIYKRL